jgi:hypothetical protein
VILFALHKRISVPASVRSLCVKSFFTLFASELTLSFIKARIVIGFQNRSSSISFFLLLAFAWDFFLFFLPCLFFDARRLTAGQLVLFSVKIALLPGNAVELTGLVFAQTALVLLGPFTFGVSYWLGYSLRITFYYQLCGTASPTPNQSV